MGHQEREDKIRAPFAEKHHNYKKFVTIEINASENGPFWYSLSTAAWLQLALAIKSSDHILGYTHNRK